MRSAASQESLPTSITSAVARCSKAVSSRRKASSIRPNHQKMEVRVEIDPVAKGLNGGNHSGHQLAPGRNFEIKNCIERAVVVGDGDIIQPEDLPYHIRQRGQVIDEPLESLERDHITRVLRNMRWRKSEAAKLLGISRQTLDNKIRAYKIRR